MQKFRVAGPFGCLWPDEQVYILANQVFTVVIPRCSKASEAGPRWIKDGIVARRGPAEWMLELSVPAMGNATCQQTQWRACSLQLAGCRCSRSGSSSTTTPTAVLPAANERPNIGIWTRARAAPLPPLPFGCSGLLPSSLPLVLHWSLSHTIPIRRIP